MDMEKLTIKSREALNGAHELAVERKHQQLFPVHLFASLAAMKDGIVPEIFKKLNVPAE